MSIGISVQDKAMEMTRSAPKGTHYLADVAVFSVFITLVVLKAHRQKLNFSERAHGYFT